MRQRLEPDIRRKLIVDAAVRLSKRFGYQHITRDAVAIEAQCANGLISRYFKTFPLLKLAVLKAAIEEEHLDILAQGLAYQEPVILKAPEKLKRKITQYLIK